MEPQERNGYKLVRLIGSGGFGEVWQAEAPGGIPVAVKVLAQRVDPDQAKRELQTLERIMRLRHPFLLQTLALFTHQDRLHIVMELAERSLRDRLKECQQQGLPGIPPDELLRYFREATEGIDYLHRQQFLHGDVKPDNLLLLRGHVKVADSGLTAFPQELQGPDSAIPSWAPRSWPTSWLAPAGARFSGTSRLWAGHRRER